MTERTYTADEVDAMIARAVAATKPANTLHFAQWTNGEKDLSNYIIVGHLTLAAIEDGEYGASEIDPLDSTIDALQEHLITGDSKKVPLLAYIGGLNAAAPAAQPAPVQPVALHAMAKRRIFDAIRGAYDLGYNDARGARAVHGDSAPGYKGRDVEADHGGALFSALERYATPPAAQPVTVQEPDCDRSACGDFSPGPCDNPNCPALRATPPAEQSAYKDSTPELSVGDSSFESWYEQYLVSVPVHQGRKQRARDAYAAGMGDPLVAPAAQQTQPQVYGWVRMNGQFNSGVFHLGRECPSGWVGAAEPVSLIVAADLGDELEGGAA